MPRYLGQHFLINKSAIQKIIAALDLKKDETVIEIGPGEGALTLPLVRKCSEIDDRCKIIAVEKDNLLANDLKKLIYSKFQSSIFELITGDALTILPQIISSIDLRSSNYKIAGNIPYYITGKLLRILGELNQKPKLTILTIQKEVAERVVAHPPKMNLLAAAVQFWADAKIIGRLASKNFSPPPKVDSAIIKLESRIQNLESRGIERYYKLIKLVFKQPRKTLLNNLSTGLDFKKEEILKTLQEMGLKGDERPQNLSLSQLLLLSRGLG